MSKIASNEKACIGPTFGPLKLCLAFYYNSRSYNEKAHFCIQISIRHPCYEKTVRKRNEFQNKNWLIIRFLIVNVKFYVNVSIRLATLSRKS